MLGYNRLSAPCAANRRARRAAAASVSATRTSSGIESAMEAIRVLGRVRMSVFYLILGVIVRKIQNSLTGLILPTRKSADRRANERPEATPFRRGARLRSAGRPVSKRAGRL